MNTPGKVTVIVEQAGVFRRLAALVYDVFLIAAIWFAISGIAVSLNGGEALPSWANHYLLFPSINLATFLFYYWFWTHGGQTLGMRAWRLKIATLKNKTPSLTQCIKRFCTVYFFVFIGFIASSSLTADYTLIYASTVSFGLLTFSTCPFNQQKKSVHDLSSDTQIVLLPKE